MQTVQRRPAQCDDPKYRRYLAAINSLETWIPHLDGNCCQLTGLMNYDDLFGPTIHLDVAVVSAGLQGINENKTAFQWPTKTITFLYPDHQKADYIAREYTAHEWGHAYMVGYNASTHLVPGLSASSQNFWKSYSEGFADFIAVMWSHYAGVDSDWDIGDIRRPINVARQWSTPTSNHHESGRMFSNFYYRILDSGVPKEHVIQLALYVTRELLPTKAASATVLDTKDFAQAVHEYTSSAYGSAALRKAACKAWYDMGIPDSFCKPEKATISLAFQGCDAAGTAWYYAAWQAGDINTDFYALDLYTIATGWYTNELVTRNWSYIYNNGYIDAKFRVRSCNEWYCTASNDVAVADFCVDPPPGQW